MIVGQNAVVVAVGQANALTATWAMAHRVSAAIQMDVEVVVPPTWLKLSVQPVWDDNISVSFQKNLTQSLRLSWRFCHNETVGKNAEESKDSLANVTIVVHKDTVAMQTDVDIVQAQCRQF